MTDVKVAEAKTPLSDLLVRVEAGEEIIIARDDVPIVRLAGARARAKFVTREKSWSGGARARETHNAPPQP
jgi:antitoxin (DNA-binding transcriptional repressor) of toxin-antitoxin stability system